MNLHQHPELLEQLAASHALGTMRHGARRRFEALARQDPQIRAAALVWQARLSGLAELQTQSEPSPAVWTRIDNLVKAEKQQKLMEAARQEAGQTPSVGGWLRSLGLWRGLAAGGVAAAVVAVVTGVQVHGQLGHEIDGLQARLLATPQIQYVAVLADDRSAASMLVTFDARNSQLELQRVGNFHETPDKSLQLWALPPVGAPRSLGVLGADQVLRLPTGAGDVRQVPTLAISLEPHGGVPSAGGPTGPVLFKGALIQKQS